MKCKSGDNLDNAITSWTKVDWEGLNNLQELAPSLPVPITPTRQSATNGNADPSTPRLGNMFGLMNVLKSSKKINKVRQVEEE